VAEEAYYLDGSRNQQGPVPVAEIARLVRNGTIRRDTLVWYPGMPDWRPASQVNEFASLFGQAAPPPRPPAGPSPPAFAGAAPMQRPASLAGAYPGQAPRVQAQQVDSGGSMGFGGAIATCFRKYVDFTGRARRKEYWFWHLFYWLLLVVLVILDGAILGMGGRAAVFTSLGMLALILPTLAVTVRRLHDTDHSGWMIFITLIPLIGSIVFIVFMCQRGTAGPNRFGQDPLGLDAAAAFD
jgi:uncharacterized membrane protein YhaH (DUF805 family)